MEQTTQITVNCPECNAPIKIFFDSQEIIFYGDPAFCLCRVSEEDIDRFNLKDEHFTRREK